MQLSQFLLSHLDDEILIELIQVNELFGTADAVRAVHDRIRGDFIVINSDTFSQINVAELVYTHRLQSSDVTMLLAAAPLEESEKKGAPPVMKVFLSYHYDNYNRFTLKIKNLLEYVMMDELY